MKVAIVGSRDWPELDRVGEFVEKLAEKYPTAVVVSGGARGVDRTAEAVALKCGLRVVSYRCVAGHTFRYQRRPDRPDVALAVPGGDYSQGAKNGARDALHRRNGWIIEEADRVVAFDALTGGTKDAVEKTLALGRPLVRYFVGVAEPDVHDEARLIASLIATFDAVEVVEDEHRPRAPFDLDAHLRKIRQKEASDRILADAEQAPSTTDVAPTESAPEPTLFDMEAPVLRQSDRG